MCDGEEKAGPQHCLGPHTINLFHIYTDATAKAASTGSCRLQLDCTGYNLAVDVPERSSEGRRPYTVLSYPQAPTSDEDSEYVYWRDAECDGGRERADSTTYSTSCAWCTAATPTQLAKLCGHHHQAYLERERGSINDILAPIAAIRQSLGELKADIEHHAVTQANLPAERTQLVPDGNTSGITSSSSPTSTPSQQSKQPRQTPCVSSSNTPASAFSNDAPDHSCDGQRVHVVLHHAETSNPSDPQTAPTRVGSTLPSVLASVDAANAKASQFAAPDPKRRTVTADPAANSTQLVPVGNASSPPQQLEQPRQTPSASSSNISTSTPILKHSSAAQKVYTVLYHAEAFKSSNDQRPETRPEAILLGVFGSVGAANTRASHFADTRLADEIEDGFDDVSDPYERSSARESLGYGCHGTRSFAIDGRIRFCVNSFTTGPKTLESSPSYRSSSGRGSNTTVEPTAVTSAATTNEFSQPDKWVYAVLYHAVGTLQAYLPGIALLAEEPEATTVGIYDSLGAANSRASRVANEHTPSYQRFEDVDDPEETLVPEKLDASACTRSYATDGRVRFCLNTYSNGSKTVAVTKHLLRADAPNRSSDPPRYEFAVLHRLIREEEPSSEMIENFSFEETGVYQSLEEANKVALDLSVHHHAGVTREPDRWSRNPLSLWPCPDEADIRISSRGRNGEMRYVFWQLDRVQPSQSSCAWYVVERRRLF
ncbi:hypothetical protein LTR56_004213 [Elasticomyces elasticus]|nr:hypothetical protein LTR56_004213 [Elasticomyces elasticus]KAK3655102.1 hypothetical protein LTR22_010412 [Elasticomyces elasticus]KAK4910897.1 hypothetical protein LTR49_020509 [Elasticomyces elasticus]KAK5750316.1 hypothetical protein LTS12_019655 [Elasticomyces elasticus]